MLFQRYMTGRGNLGYGFRAQTTKVPITPYLKLRASDTGDTNRMLLEIMTTSYNELAAIGSCYDREQSNGYTDILFATPEGETEWEEVLDNPGRLLYLPHINKADFLETSTKGKTVALGGGVELALPEITHKYDQRFHIDEDMLAELVADIWFAASKRLTEADQPGSWPVINIRLTDENEWESTVEIGREFYCNVLMPALPRALRRIVSVCIGGRYGDVSNAANGGAAAVLITLPDDRNELVPGTYVITPNDLRRQSLNPFQDAQSWRTFGRAVIKYAQSGLAALENEEKYLSDFFAVSEQIEKDEKHQAIRHLTANWPYAFLLFSAHQNAADAARQSGEFAADVEPGALNETFNESVWESADPTLLEEFGFDTAQARNCYVWLENHVVDALISNKRIEVSSERYEELTKRAFTLKHVQDAVNRDELLQAYETLLLRGTLKEKNNALELLLTFMSDQAMNTLMFGQPAQLASLMAQALKLYEEDPSEECLKLLAAYARRGVEEQTMVTDYAIALLAKDVDYKRLSLLRPVQQGDMLDRAVIDHFRGYENIKRCTESEFRAALKEYAETVAGANAMQERTLKDAFAEIMGGYIAERASTYRNSLEQVYKMFADIGMEKSTDAMSALTECLEGGDLPVNDGDVVYIVTVLDSEHTQCADHMLGVLRELFENGLPNMFKQGKLTAAAEHTVIDNCWKDCLRRTTGSKRNELRSQLASCLLEYVTQESEAMRYQMPSVVQAFKELGFDSSKDDVFMQALCVCMEVSGENFTRQDASDILPVLRSNSPQAQRMANAVLKTFAESVPVLLAEQSNPEEQPWKLCIRDSKLSDAQQQLGQSIRDFLQNYMLEKPNTLVYHLDRVLELLRAYGCIDAEKTVEVCCGILRSQALLLDEDAVLAEKDLKLVNALDFKNVSDASKAALADALHALYAKKLPVLGKDEAACEHWRSCLKNKHLGELLKVKSQQSFAEYVDACTATLETDATDDRLVEFLQIAASLEWQRVEVVRKAIAKYFTTLGRSELQQAEILGLLSLRSNLNREIDDGLRAVFNRALLRLLKGGEEVKRWIPVSEEMDLRETFQKTIQQTLANAKTAQETLGKVFILSLIDFSNVLTALRPAAVTQAIRLIEDSKSVLADDGRVASRLISEEEHVAVLSAVLNCNQPQLFNQYIDLLAYEPVDSGNADNEKLLRKEMIKMRETLFVYMNADEASYAARTHEVWKKEIRDALLNRLTQLSSTEGLTFQQLCQLPQRWAVECQNWRFVSFTELTRYVDEREKLQAAVIDGATAVISRSPLAELKQNPLHGEDHWYAILIGELVAQRAGTDVRILADECETPQALEDLLTMLNETGAAVSEHTRQALNLIHNGAEKNGVLGTLAALRELEEEMPLGVTLLRKAVFGHERSKWSKWDSVNCSGRIPLAAICYLTGTSKDWKAFFSVLFEDTTVEKTALAEGKDPVQALIFASSVLHDMQMDTEADEMVDALKSWRREEHAHVRAIGRKRRELAALREAVVWKETGASQKLYELLFTKN